MVINHTMCTLKILADLCFTKQRIKTKNVQSVKLEKGAIEFNNYSNKYQPHLKFMLILSAI